jgi:hypothetical protein
MAKASTRAKAKTDGARVARVPKAAYEAELLRLQAELV